MTAERYRELKRGAAPLPEEIPDFERLQKWEALRAVATKHRTYTTWPTRRRDHKRRPACTS